MSALLNHPRLVFVISLVILWLAAVTGASFRKRALEEDERDDLDMVLAATLTLLGLIIGFTFSMAINRYDQRKNYEEAEANAIGTEYVRADLLPADNATKLRVMLRDYLNQRVLFYEAGDKQQLQQVNAYTAQLQTEMWSAVASPAKVQPTPLTALAVAGMNDVLNSQGYTQAAWWNRIPSEAWALMITIAVGCNLLVGYSARRTKGHRILFLVLPFAVSISFFLIADIDSPRAGVIRLQPQNLVSLAQSLQAH